jgi:hypothetical protein
MKMRLVALVVLAISFALPAFSQQKDAQEKTQTAQQHADRADNQRSALETELKNAQEEKAKDAQDAALVGKIRILLAQSSLLQTQLKDAQEKTQTEQQHADRADNQRGALETRLKKAQVEKAQLAQQNTDFANQLGALEAQVKKAQEEKIQLIQQDANLSSQSRDLQTQLRTAQDEKAQLARQNANLINQSNALQAQLENSEEKTQTAQRNTDLATSQRNVLEAQLKDEQEKLLQVQASLDRATGRLGELEAQLRQEQERAQKAQTNADFANSELRAVRLEQSSVEGFTNPLMALMVQPAMNVRYSESRIAADAIFPWFLTRVNPEEKQSGLAWGRNARLNPPQDASPTPSPSIKEPETSNPPEPQIDRNAEASGEEEFLKEFVLGYLRTVASNDTSGQRQYFAERVNFYGRGVLNASNLEASTQRYHDEWPIRQWTPRGEAKLVRSSNPNLFVAYQPFNWSVSDGSHNAHGAATLYLRIRKNSQGEFQIVYVRQLDH